MNPDPSAKIVYPVLALLSLPFAIATSQWVESLPESYGLFLLALCLTVYSTLQWYRFARDLFGKVGDEVGEVVEHRFRTGRPAPVPPTMAYWFLTFLPLLLYAGCTVLLGAEILGYR